MEKEVTLERFINEINPITEDLMSWSIRQIYRKDDTKHPFLNWDKIYLDDVCSRDCSCQLKEWAEEEGDGALFECEKLEIPCYINQWSVGDSGDSYQGVMVFDLKDYYVEMSYSV